MSRSDRKPGRGSGSVRALPAQDGFSEEFQPPATVSRLALLENGSDRRFRRLVSDLFTISVRMEAVREQLGKLIGISGPQYSVVVMIAQLQGAKGVSVGTLAKALHVSSAFIATETGRLARLGLVAKRPNPEDRRGVLLRLTVAGRERVAKLAPQIRAVNDRFFAPLDEDSFAALTAACAALVQSSARAIRVLPMLLDEEELAAAE